MFVMVVHALNKWTSHDIANMVFVCYINLVKFSQYVSYYFIPYYIYTTCMYIKLRVYINVLSNPLMIYITVLIFKTWNLSSLC